MAVKRRTAPKRSAAIDAYLTTVRPAPRALLRDLRETIHALVPGVEECISYGLPAFRHEGHVIAGFSATSKGCSFYPFSGATLRTLARDVEGYSQTKSALHFGPEPLPVSLVRKLLEARIEESRRARYPARGDAQAKGTRSTSHQGAARRSPARTVRRP